MIQMPVASPVEYVWIGGQGELRSKTRIIYHEIYSLEQIPQWNFDGSSTKQATSTTNSEIFIYPCYLIRCPFRRPNGFIVMCDTYNPDESPSIQNNRFDAAKIFDLYKESIPWFGLEQEYFIFDNRTNLPFYYDPSQVQGQFYCSVGSGNVEYICRTIVEEHLEACLYSGIKISGINSEVANGQFEYQIGTVEGIEAADQLWVSRYILQRIGEKYNAKIVLDPKPLDSWNGSGCHTNFSTEAMRTTDGLDLINKAIDKLKILHPLHMEFYGKDNEKRMTGIHETSNYKIFTSGVGDRGASVRIPSEVVKNKQGYFEDRRPGANMDPYLVTSLILKTIME